MRRALLLLLAVAAAALSGAGAARATTVTGTVSLTMASSALDLFKRDGVRIAVRAPARLTKSNGVTTIVLPVASGAPHTLALRGTVTFTSRFGKLVVANPRVRPFDKNVEYLTTGTTDVLVVPPAAIPATYEPGVITKTKYMLSTPAGLGAAPWKALAPHWPVDLAVVFSSFDLRLTVKA